MSKSTFSIKLNLLKLRFKNFFLLTLFKFVYLKKISFIQMIYITFFILVIKLIILL